MTHPGGWFVLIFRQRILHKLYRILNWRHNLLPTSTFLCLLALPNYNLPGYRRERNSDTYSTGFSNWIASPHSWVRGQFCSSSRQQAMQEAWPTDAKGWDWEWISILNPFQHWCLRTPPITPTNTLISAPRHSPDTWMVKVIVSSIALQIYFPEYSGPAVGMTRHLWAPASSRTKPLLASSLLPSLTQQTGAFSWESTQVRVTVSPVEDFRTEGALRGCTIFTGGSGRRGQAACWRQPQATWLLLRQTHSLLSEEHLFAKAALARGGEWGWRRRSTSEIQKIHFFPLKGWSSHGNVFCFSLQLLLLPPPLSLLCTNSPAKLSHNICSQVSCEH